MSDKTVASRMETDPVYAARAVLRVIVMDLSGPTKPQRQRTEHILHARRLAERWLRQFPATTTTE